MRAMMKADAYPPGSLRFELESLRERARAVGAVHALAKLDDIDSRLAERREGTLRRVWSQEHRGLDDDAPLRSAGP
jgi:hypothetical protein